MRTIFIGFDFSMNKPAMTVFAGKSTHFYIWPLDMSDKDVARYEANDVVVRARGLDSVKKTETVVTKTGRKRKVAVANNSSLVLEHTRRSVELADMIVMDIDKFADVECAGEDYQLYVASEGLSYGSTGDAVTNLATYKGVLLAKIYEHYGDRLKGLYTYSPITMKSVAGCARKDELGKKLNMIEAFQREDIEHRFRHALSGNELRARINYIDCVDDIVDSYWVAKTMLIKEGFVR